MRNDYSYIKQLLDVFLDHPQPDLKMRDLSQFKDVDDHKFVHHMEILIDRGLICAVWPNEILTFSRRIDCYLYPSSPIRLTADGHDFASELAKSGTLKVISERFQEEGLSVVIEVAKKLAKSRIEKELNKLV
ncbi:DUF2513 domain-containing protein [Aliivibrio sp. S10_S31]|uniref:DUF2513 domain-containing protein n=1 Tax=Aliivibrio sp. S10_S31 TaxID=2720224 RepID=UPI0016809F62|nr:DUF2513 domain-containing protein [Aliivibrio sp. S10_S31]MBD1571506.1 DUF2513 domain-containing protein [Aliivibrio sp. S10_S31]